MRPSPRQLRIASLSNQSECVKSPIQWFGMYLTDLQYAVCITFHVLKQSTTIYSGADYNHLMALFFRIGYRNSCPFTLC